MIPWFDDTGNLPPGIHKAEWDEMVERFDTTKQRHFLLVGLGAALLALQKAGCETVYLNGSFVTTKENPVDYDGCWDLKGVSLELLDPVLMDFTEHQYAQKQKYRGELFPNLPPNGGESAFLDLFQTDKHTGNRKGIVAIDLKTFE